METDIQSIDLEPYLKHANGIIDVKIEVGRYSNVRKMEIYGPNPNERKEELLYKVLNTSQQKIMYEGLMKELNEKYDQDPQWESLLYKKRHLFAVRKFKDDGIDHIPNSLPELIDSIYQFLFHGSIIGIRDREERTLLFEWYRNHCIAYVK